MINTSSETCWTVREFNRGTDDHTGKSIDWRYQINSSSKARDFLNIERAEQECRVANYWKSTKETYFKVHQYTREITNDIPF